MGAWVADQIDARFGGKNASVLVLGLTFKENVPDLRNSKVVDLIDRLGKLGHDVSVHDPIAEAGDAAREYGLTLSEGALGQSYDCVIGAVAHSQYRAMGADQVSALLKSGGLLADLKHIWPAIADAPHWRETGKRYWSL